MSQAEREKVAEEILDRYSKTIDTLRATIDELVKRGRVEGRDLQAEIDELNAQIKTIEGKIKALESSPEGQIVIMRRKVAQLQGEMSAIDKLRFRWTT